MRVGLLCHAGVGGSARVAVGLANALATRGHEVHVIARRDPLGGGALSDGVRLHRLHSVAPRLSAKLDNVWTDAELNRMTALVHDVVRHARLDVLHAHYAWPFALVASRAGDRDGSRRPTRIVTLHGTDVTGFRSSTPHGRALREALRAADALTTVSRHYAALARTTFQLPARPSVIPNFVDVGRFRPPLRPDRRRRRPRLVHVSNFRAVKDPETMARVYLRVRRRIPAELWLVGGGDGLPAVRSLLSGAGADGDVRYLGLRRQVHDVLPHCDALLLTSREESFSLAALEASACGVPVVAMDVGGVASVVVDRETGFLVPPRDETAAASAVVRLLSQPLLRDAMGAAGVRHASRFATARVLPHYEQVYASLLGDSRSAVPRGVVG